MKIKKWAALLLCTLMLVSVFSGCAPADGPGESTASPKPAVLNVGFGRADITPTDPAPLSGLSGAETRIWTDILDHLYASCIAFTDQNDNTILMFSIDNLCVSEAMLYGASAIAKETGVPYGNIIIGTTHSHSAPSGSSTNEGAIKYGEQLKVWMMEAAKAALADRKPATMHFTTAKPEGINFIRHYIMSDGTYLGDNFGSATGKTYVGHVREVDNTLQLVKFVREDAKDIIMMNWQGHPTGHSGNDRDKVLSFSGRVTEAVEAGLDCHCLYVLGASGNVNNNSRIKTENAFNTYQEKAAGLAQYVIDADSTYQQAEVGNVQVLAQTIACEGKGGGKADVPIDAYSIGDLGLIGAPYEMFCENGQAIKAGSPFKMTFVSTCTNMRAGSYIPSISTWDYNNKPDEVYGIRNTSYAKGTAEILQDSFVSMLNELYKTK